MHSSSACAGEGELLVITQAGGKKACCASENAARIKSHATNKGGEM